MQRAIAMTVATTLAVAPACSIQRRGLVTGAALHATMRERQSSGQSDVPGLERRGDATRPTAITVHRGQRLWLDGQALDVDELERGCPADPSAPPAGADCALTRLGATELEVYSYREPHLGTTAKVTGGVVGAGLIGAAVCTGLCADDSTAHTVARDVLIGAGVAAAATALYLVVTLAILRSSGT